MFKDIETLRAKIREHKLDHLQDALINLARPTIHISRALTDDAAIPIGASKLGGDPDLPADFQWPHYNDKPLTFIGQFQLAELTEYDTEELLPKMGILSYFYETDEIPWGTYDERDAWQVVYVEDENTPLVRVPHPTHQGEFEMIQALPAHRVTFTTGLTLPTIHSHHDDRCGIAFEGKTDRRGVPRELKTYVAMLDDASPDPLHAFLGYPRLIQHPVEFECVENSQDNPIPYTAEPAARQAHIDAIKAQMDQWQFLFQIDSDDSLQVMWADLGKLYICIPRASLAARRFDDCWTIMQCF